MPDSLFIKSKQLIELSGDLTLQLALLYPFKKDGANGLTMGSKPILAAPIQSTPYHVLSADQALGLVGCAVSEYAERSIRGDIGIYDPEVDGEGPEEFHGRVHDIALDSLEDFMNLSGREARLSGAFDDLDDDIKFGPLTFSLNYPMALLKIFGTIVEIPPHPFTGSYSRSRHIAPSF